MYGQTQIFPLFPPYLGSLVIKAVAFVKISSFAYFVLCPMYGHIQIVHYLPIYFSSLVLKAMAIIKISSFSPASYMASCAMYIQIQKLYTISPLVWLVGCKCWGNYRNFDNFPSKICHLVHIVKSS